jgi:hypothetical protein
LQDRSLKAEPSGWLLVHYHVDILCPPKKKPESEQRKDIEGSFDVMSGVKEFAEVEVDVHGLVSSRVLEELQGIEATEQSLTILSVAIEGRQNIYGPTLSSESSL